MGEAVDRPRCSWARGEAMIAYHDHEWGVPTRDERELFELLVLEGAQAGLAWRTILEKRDGYRRAFAGFDPERVAAFEEADVERLLGDRGIVRHRGKIESAVTNARAVVAIRREHGDFADWLLERLGDVPRRRWSSIEAIPASTPASSRLSRALKAAGFGFVGPTTCYAFMQAAGFVNDHVVDCFRHAEVERLRDTG